MWILWFHSIPLLLFVTLWSWFSMYFSVIYLLCCYSNNDMIGHQEVSVISNMGSHLKVTLWCDNCCGRHKKIITYESLPILCSTKGQVHRLLADLTLEDGDPVFLCKFKENGSRLSEKKPLIWCIGHLLLTRKFETDIAMFQ